MTPTTELTERIVERIRKGQSPSGAARAEGVTRSTFLCWVIEGEHDQDSPQGGLCAALNVAEAESESTAVALLQKATRGDWSAAVAFLARRFPERWGERPSESPSEEKS